MRFCLFDVVADSQNEDHLNDLLYKIEPSLLDSFKFLIRMQMSV